MAGLLEKGGRHGGRPSPRSACRRAGFTLVEVLVACALLAAVIVPLMRAFNANARAADIFVEDAARDLRAASAEAEAEFSAEPKTLP